MVKKEKLRCDSCGKEEVEDDTAEWLKKLIPGKDFCSQKCASKYVKKEYVEDEVEEITEPDPIIAETAMPSKLRPQPIREEVEGSWELRNMPSQYTPTIYNKETKDVVETQAALALILNRLDELLKRL